MQGIVAEGDARGRGPATRARIVLRLVAGCLLAAPIPGCYVMQAVTGEMQVMASSRPMSKVLRDPATPPATRAQIKLAVEARRFATSTLGLPDSGSFRSYAEIGREYVLWNVVATPEFSLEPLQWCFFVAGCVSYRGYFREHEASAFAWKLAARGNDTVVEGVAAYSTLGRLSDPLLSTMIDWNEANLVGTIFHELAHERVYVAGDSAFNESFASVVEDAGLRRWFESRGDGAGLAAYEKSQRRHAGFVALLSTAANSLEHLYGGSIPVAEKRVEKNRIFGRLKFAYQELRHDWGGYGGYDEWFARPLNNASLASVGTYRDCVPGLQRELATAGSLEAFYARAEVLAKLPLADRHAVVCREGVPGTDARHPSFLSGSG